MTDKTEQRWVKALVRTEGAQGTYFIKAFEVTVPVTGSYHIMVAAAIAAIRQQGYETNRILDHATRRELL